MLNSMFQSIFNSETVSVVSFIICILTALALGLLTALAHNFRTETTRSFLMTVAILPALVTVVVMMVNGNLGVGVAVAGAFGLIRFRSAQGSARELATIFLTMGTGLICGMGYIGYAMVFTVIMCLVLMVYTAAGFGSSIGENERTLRITIPEDLDYVGVFDEIFNKYTSSYNLTSVKTSNMGSLFKLKYDVTMKPTSNEKEFIDKLRVRNGNLEIALSVRENDTSAEL